MSGLQMKTKLEFLPNELFIKCFKYLDSFEIFKSFDFLNTRFSQLIRNVSLHLNIGGKEKFELVRFGIKLILNPQIKKHIKSLKIMPNSSLDDVDTLLSFISPEEFSGLQALIILRTNRNIISHLSSVLPRLTNLRYLFLEVSFFNDHHVVSSLPTSTLQTLIISSLSIYLPPAEPLTSLTNLTLNYCCIEELYDFFRYLPQLKRLKVERFSDSLNPISKKSDLSDIQLIHLERLIIDHFDTNFDSLEILLQRTPNLKVFNIFAVNSDGISDARRWQKLIKNSLTSLDVFQFDFCFDIGQENENFVNDFQRFQTDFWVRQHCWYTEYVINAKKTFIHTIPYMCNEYSIAPKTKRYRNLANDHTNMFTKVTDLIVCISEMTNHSEYYFPNVASLTLCNASIDGPNNFPFLRTKHIDGLKTMMNLCNLTHLEITPEFRWKSTNIVSQLFNEPFRISSLKLDKSVLFSMLRKGDLCECLNNMITKLSITNYLSTDEMEKICQIFSNMKEFQCSVSQINTFQMIIDQLSKLSSMKVFTYKTYGADRIRNWLKDNQSEVKLYSFVIRCEDAYDHVDDYSEDSDLDYDSENYHYNARYMNDDSDLDF